MKKSLGSKFSSAAGQAGSCTCLSHPFVESSPITVNPVTRAALVRRRAPLGLSSGRRQCSTVVRPIRRAHGPEALEGRAHHLEEDRGEAHSKSRRAVALPYGVTSRSRPLISVMDNTPQGCRESRTLTPWNNVMVEMGHFDASRPSGSW